MPYTTMAYEDDWRELPVWALTLLNAHARSWKPYFLNFSDVTSGHSPCLVVRFVSDEEYDEKWEVHRHHGIRRMM